MPPPLSEYDSLFDSEPDPGEESATEECPATRLSMDNDPEEPNETISVVSEPVHANQKSQLGSLQPKVLSQSNPSPQKPRKHLKSRQSRSTGLQPETPLDPSPPKKRKHANLLMGLDFDNIITSHTTPDSDDIADSVEPSAPASSYNIRARSKPKSILYDQKYHPMDEFIRPSRAAHIRAKHEDPVTDSEATHHSFSDSSSEGDGNHKLPPKKLRISSSSQPPQGTRRSSRRVNHNPLYNMKLHPQDSALNLLGGDYSDDDSMAVQYAGRNDQTSAIVIEDSEAHSNPGEDDLFDSDLDSLSESELIKDGIYLHEDFVTAENTGRDHNSISGAKKSKGRSNLDTLHKNGVDLGDNRRGVIANDTLNVKIDVPKSTAGFGAKAANTITKQPPKSKSAAVTVYEESVEAQLANERSLEALFELSDDENHDKENKDPRSVDDDLLDRTVVQSVAQFLSSYGDDLDGLLDGINDDLESLRHDSPRTMQNSTLAAPFSEARSRSASFDDEANALQISTPRYVLGDITSLV